MTNPGSESTILIASPECLRTLHEQPYFSASSSFSDAEALKALHAIRRHKPDVVALERAFVASQAGQKFLREIKTDQGLSTCLIEVVDMRRMPRYRPREHIEIRVHGRPVSLLDVSLSGAQVLSAAALKPNQRVRVALGDGERPVIGHVIWSRFEMPQDGAHYRAGIEFASTSAPTLTAFLERFTS